MNRVVVHITSGLQNGGAEGVLFKVCTKSNHFKHRVISLTGPGKYGPLLSARGIEVQSLNMGGLWSSVSGLVTLLFLLAKNRSAVVQTWMYHGNLIGGCIAKLVGVEKIVWNIRHGHLTKSHGGYSTLIIDWLSRILSGVIPTVIVCCAKSVRTICHESGYAEKKLMVISNGYSEVANVPSDDNLPPVLDGSFNVIGMVARYNPQKDHRTLFEAVRLVLGNVDDLRLVLIGPGINSENSALVNDLEECGLQEITCLLGERDDAQELMRQFSLNVLSSSSGEGFPNVLAEAMLVEVPCIATDVGEAAEIIGPTGWIVPPANAGRLAEVLRLAFAEKDDAAGLWEVRKKSCRERIVRKFGEGRMIESYEYVWT